MPGVDGGGLGGGGLGDGGLGGAGLGGAGLGGGGLGDGSGDGGLDDGVDPQQISLLGHKPGPRFCRLVEEHVSLQEPKMPSQEHAVIEDFLADEKDDLRTLL